MISGFCAYDLSDVLQSVQLGVSNMRARMREEEPSGGGFGSQFAVLQAPPLLNGHHFAQVSETPRSLLISLYPSTVELQLQM